MQLGLLLFFIVLIIIFASFYVYLTTGEHKNPLKPSHFIDVIEYFDGKIFIDDSKESWLELDCVIRDRGTLFSEGGVSTAFVNFFHKDELFERKFLRVSPSSPSMESVIEFSPPWSKDIRRAIKEHQKIMISEINEKNERQKIIHDEYYAKNVEKYNKKERY